MTMQRTIARMSGSTETFYAGVPVFRSFRR